MELDTSRDYPLGARRPELVTTAAGTPLDAVTLDAARAGSISAEELRATPETLRRQAGVARAAGRSQLAENLERAAELRGGPGRRAARDLHGGYGPGARQPSSWRRGR